MKLRIPVLVATLCMFSLADTVPADIVSGGSGSISSGYISLSSLDNINSHLESLTLPTLASGYTTVGFTGHYMIGELFVGAEAHAILEGERSAGGLRGSLLGGYFQPTIGYLAYTRGHLAIIPQIGLGYVMLQVNVEDDVIGSVNTSTVQSSGYVMDFSMGMEYILPLDKSGRSTIGPVLGIRMGYTHPLSKTQWDLTEDCDINRYRFVEDIPALETKGFYVRFSIGGGGYVVN
jgi:hypothetical protein